MSQWVISIDCDNVLVDTASAFLQYYEMNFWTKVDRDDIREAYIQDNDCFDLRKWWREEYRIFFERAHKQWYMTPFWSSVSQLKALKEYGYELHIVTWRLLLQEELTRTWSNKFYPWLFNGIHFGQDHTTDKVTKWDLCKKIWAKLHIDDFLHYGLEVVDAGIPVLLYTSPRNTDKLLSSSLLTRINSRDQLTPDFIQWTINASN